MTYNLLICWAHRTQSDISKCRPEDTSVACNVTADEILVESKREVAARIGESRGLDGAGLDLKTINGMLRKMNWEESIEGRIHRLVEQESSGYTTYTKLSHEAN